MIAFTSFQITVAGGKSTLLVCVIVAVMTEQLGKDIDTHFSLKAGACMNTDAVLNSSEFIEIQQPLKCRIRNRRRYLPGAIILQQTPAGIVSGLIW